MSIPGSGSTVLDGVDIDAVASAVRACPGVNDLYSSKTASVASYLPGRRLSGVRIDAQVVTVQVRTEWDVPLDTVCAGITRAVAGLVGPRRVDVIIGDITDPPTTTTSVATWTPTAVPPDAPSSAAPTPTAAATLGSS